MISRNQEKLEKIKIELESNSSESNNKIINLAIDFDDIDQSVLFEKLDETLLKNEIEKVKILINNVGFGPYGPYILR